MRKIIQISASDNGISVLCDDGTVWCRPWGGDWRQLEPIPDETQSQNEAE
jgi:hypothetical protein